MFMPSVKWMEEEEEVNIALGSSALRAEKGLKFRSFVGGGASLNEAAHKMTATKIQRSTRTCHPL